MRPTNRDNPPERPDEELVGDSDEHAAKVVAGDGAQLLAGVPVEQQDVAAGGRAAHARIAALT